MSYDSKHTEDDCDRCTQRVGRKNLRPLPFAYLDKNDQVHPDVSPEIKARLVQERKKALLAVSDGDELLAELYARQAAKLTHVEPGYRQYYVCPECLKTQKKMISGVCRRTGDPSH